MRKPNADGINWYCHVTVEHEYHSCMVCSAVAGDAPFLRFLHAIPFLLIQVLSIDIYDDTRAPFVHHSKTLW